LIGVVVVHYVVALLLGVAVLFWESCMEWFTGLESKESNLV